VIKKHEALSGQYQRIETNDNATKPDNNNNDNNRKYRIKSTYLLSPSTRLTTIETGSDSAPKVKRRQPLSGTIKALSSPKRKHLNCNKKFSFSYTEKKADRACDNKP
jgi:hypothetical protein